MLADAKNALQVEAKKEATSFAPCDIAAIAAECWRALLEAGDNGLNKVEIEQELVGIVLASLLANHHHDEQGVKPH